MRTDSAANPLPPGDPWSASDWRIPLGLALAVHVLALLLLILSPYFQSRRPIIDVQTVNLFNASEIEPAPAPKKIAPPMAPAKTKKTVAPPPSIAPAVPKVASKPPVSLKPLKSKSDAAEHDLKANQTILERKLRQVRASVEKERAEKEVRKEIDTALERIRQSYAGADLKPSAETQPSSANGPLTPTATSGGAGSGSVEISEAKKRYYAAIQMALSRYWTLPESHDWKESLEVIAVLWFRPDGTIVKRAFERESENDYFNRFVRLTLEKVDKVPPIPLDLPSREAELIIHDGLGFRFHPSGIY